MLALGWYCSGASLALHWYYTRASPTLALHWCDTDAILVLLHWYSCTETILGLYWYYAGTILVLGGAVLVLQQYCEGTTLRLVLTSDYQRTTRLLHEYCAITALVLHNHTFGTALVLRRYCTGAEPAPLYNACATPAQYSHTATQCQDNTGATPTQR